MVVTRVVVTAASLALPAHVPLAPFSPAAAIPVLTLPGLPTLTVGAVPAPKLLLSAPGSADVPPESSKSAAGASFNAAAKLPREHEGQDEPAAAAVPWSQELHGRAWSDPHHWMNTRWKQPPPPGLVELADAENRHSGAYFKAGEKLARKLEKEMEARAFKTPEKENLRSGKGRRAGIEALKRKTKSGGWRKAVDPADWLPAAVKWASLEDWTPSPDGRKFILKLTVDGEKKVYAYDGRKKTAHELSRSDELFDQGAWAADGKTIVYAANSLLLNKGKVYAAQPGGERRLLFSSDDASSSLELSQSAGGERILVKRSSFADQDIWAIDSDLASPPKLLVPSQPGRFVDAEYADGRFLIRMTSPEGHYDLYEASEAGAEPKLLLRGSRTADIMDAQGAGGKIYVTRRVASNPVLEIYDRSFRLLRRLSLRDAHYELAVLPQADGTVLLKKSTPLVPEILYSLGKDDVLREKGRARIPGYDPENYSLEKRFVQSPDGAMVPVTLISKKGFTGPRPVYLSAYGAYDVYELDEDHSWNLSHALSLMDRGFVVAFAHVRGGAEKGHQWMMDGRQEKRERSVEDFLAVAEWLKRSGIAEAGKLAIHSYSAGGIIVSAALNRRPELFAAAVINMGYLDFVNSLLDAGVPSAELERTMYGDPTKPGDFARMAAFSPIDNIPLQNYPPILLNTARDDWNVLFHETLKYAARLRAARRSPSRVLVDVIAPGEGEHGGRHNRHGHDAARAFSFLLRELGLEK